MQNLHQVRINQFNSENIHFIDIDRTETVKEESKRLTVKERRKSRRSPNNGGTDIATAFKGHSLREQVTFVQKARRRLTHLVDDNDPDLVLPGLKYWNMFVVI